MTLLDLVAVLLTLSTLFDSVNRKLALLPHTIGLLALATIPLVLIARAVVVAIWPALFPGWCAHLPQSSVLLLVWAGVRGGISIALSLSLPDSAAKSLPDSAAKPALLTCT